MAGQACHAEGIKDFAVGLGKGIRGLPRSSLHQLGRDGRLLCTAAGFAGQLVTWFTKMPDWAQAFLIGGFVATKLPVVGGLITEPRPRGSSRACSG